MTISRKNTNKKKIINNIFNKTGLPSDFVSTLVNNLTSILILNLLKKKIIKIKKFGTFYLRRKNKRIGRNPKNNIIHEILERNVVTFKAAENVKKTVNRYVEK